jgi:septal ring factor EnvC (AmiA/AmiB activator)
MPEEIHIPGPLRDLPDYAREHPTTMVIPVVRNGNGNGINKTVVSMLAIAGGALALPLLGYFWFQLSGQVDAHTTAITNTDRKLERVETLIEVQSGRMQEQKAMIEKQDAKMDRIYEAVNAIRREPR